MIIYPAIDLRRGRCVRLRKGDPNAETVFGEDPAQMARHWVNQGAQWLHVVNLDAAFGANQTQLDALQGSPRILIQSPGRDQPQSKFQAAIDKLPINLQRLHQIRQAVSTSIQFGGGLRTIADIELAFKLGANRVILGTVAVEDPDLVRTAINKWGAEQIVVSLDARDGKVATHGWQKTSDIDVIELGHHMHALGVRRVLFTDIARDGMLSGVNVEASARLGDVTDLQVIASGGVANIGDIERLKAREHYNIDGVIAEQALYTGNLDLVTAIEIAQRPITKRSAGIVPFRHGANGPEFLLLFNLFFEQWQFPRGGIKNDESAQTCALREFSFETGLTVKNLFEDSQTVLDYTTQIRGYNLERTIVYYLGEILPGEVTLGNENHCEARWLSADQTWELLTETSPEQLPALDAALAYLHRTV